MPATYEPIATTTLGSASSPISFTSIPNTYTDLRLVFVGTITTAGQAIIRYNSDTATNYSQTQLLGNGASASSTRATSIDSIYLDYSNNISTSTPCLSTVDIFSYAGSTNKTCLITHSLDLNGSGQVVRNVGLWRSTSAINRIDIICNNTFKIGTTATLFGIKAA